VRRVLAHTDFDADYGAQLSWLVDHGERAWIENLLEGTRQIVKTLATFPGGGSAEAVAGTLILRAIRYPKGPYRAWYVYDTADPEGELWLVRLFHARQQHPKLDPSR